MNTEILASAIVGHLVGDYLLQNDWMALNKKQKSFPCLIHCSIWTASVCVFSGWHSLQVISALFLPHFLQDRTQVIKFWMTKINRQQKFTEPPMSPWSLIVVDNVWHILTIWIVWKFTT